LALWLKKAGVEFRIIDRAEEPGTASRAIAVQTRTLEFYRQLGLANELIAAGVLVEDLKLRRKGKVVARIPIGAIGQGVSPFPYLLFYPQDLHEKLLTEHLDKLGVHVERPYELQALRQSAEGVTAMVRTPQGTETIFADYVCGCDGSHSAVRRGAGIGFPGGDYSQVFFVADVEAEGAMAEKGVQASLSEKDFCITMPVRQAGTVRLTGIVPPEKETETHLTFEDVADSVRENTGLKIKKVSWFSSYHVHHRVAEKFRDARIFLAGDAGHIHSPAGGQGMNTGIVDAVNLAWKLAAVVQGHADSKILETYNTERLAFAKRLVATTDRAFQVIASRSWFGSIWRAYIMPEFFGVLTRIPGVLKWAYRTVSQLGIAYPQSALSQGDVGKSKGRAQAGDRMPWVKLAKGDNFIPLENREWQIHVYGRLSANFHDQLKSLTLPYYVFPWNGSAAKAGLTENTVYVIRPDGYIGLNEETQDLGSLKKYLDQFGIRAGYHRAAGLATSSAEYTK
jgi:2-polyprenyl-6-methoxyphenol hydroxylase-like FAD-dependent oxidoreductase